ncbi:MAG: alpha/beta hydrolase [Bellilinea sp.]
MPLSLLILVLIIPVAILFLIVVVGLWLVKQAFYPRKFTYEKSYDLEVEHGRLNDTEFQSWSKQEVTIRSPHGYDLSGTWFPLTDSSKTIIMLHGLSYTRAGMIKYIPVFRRRGFNVLIYDQRFFGRSGGLNTSYGFYEKNDLKAAFDWVAEKTGPQGIIGTLGESMGGAIVLQHGAIDPRPAFIIADSSYADLREAMALRLHNEYHFPAFPLLNIGAWLITVFGDFNFSQVIPERDVANLQMPILFVHSLEDKEVPPSHGRRLFAAKRRGLRRLYLAPDAGHVEAAWRDRAAYDREVGEFLNDAGIM